MASACLQNPVAGLTQAAKAGTQVTASSKTSLHSSSGSLFGQKLAAKGSGSIVKSSGRALQIRNVASEPKAASLKETVSADDVFAVAANIKYHSEYTPSFSQAAFGGKPAFVATAQSVRDTLIQRWNATYEHFETTNPKMIYYLSMEFLQGRALLNCLGNLEVTGTYTEALKKLGVALEDLAEEEPNAALGNGGLGRLASCFLDSIATCNFPGWGYGLRYKYGLFKQAIDKTGQVEMAEPWLETGTPWEIVRHDIKYPIKFFGEVVNGEWVGGEEVVALAYDVPIPGYRTKNCISLRLWSAMVKASDFDLAAFNSGEHERAILAQAKADKLCSVLYPGDGTLEGKELRLKQQYMLCSASLQDIVATFERRSDGAPDWSDFPNKVAVQMNDTHPTLSGPELLRILMDIKGLEWAEAYTIMQATVAYTNHTVLPEALEKWPLDLIQKLLPRHYQIIEKIDEQFIEELIAAYGETDKADLVAKIGRMRILDNVELPPKVKAKFAVAEPAQAAKAVAAKVAKEVSAGNVEKPKAEEVEVKEPGVVRMANLCVITGHAVNGVAAIHSEIVKDEVFNEFYQLWPGKFQNKTNGVTPRRWLSFCNPELSAVITKWLGHDDWVLDADKLQGLNQYADNKELQAEWVAAKKARKLKLTAYLKKETGYTVNPDAMFDIQVKRIHEYKRQLLNILGIIYRYKKMKEMTPAERKATYVPRVCLFGGKAFATYWQAKRIVKLIADVGSVVNNDPEIGDLLKVIFVPDYNVSVAEMLIPASELSQHISTAGLEASGTSNMKFQMNGCLLIGTLDGANVEIREEVGDENFFLFGAYAPEIAGLRVERAEGKFVPEARFEEAKAFIRSGVFGEYDYEPLLDSLEGNEGFGRGDYFLVGKDFPAYVDAQVKVDTAYRNQEQWTKSSIISTATSGKFSSDRTIRQYANEIWDIKASPVP